MGQCTEERFLRDVKDHQMTIIRNDGVNRHVRFQEPGSWCYGFDLITWPGHLCVTGDCGTYVFSRLNDMFSFFVNDKNYLKKYHPEKSFYINEGYWAEKLVSVDKTSGYCEFDQDEFKRVVTQYFDSWKDDQDLSDESAKELWDAIEDQVLWAENEHQAYLNASEFDEDGFEFTDLFEHSFKQPTFHFLWNLYAIVWGIEQYESETSKEAVA